MLKTLRTNNFEESCNIESLNLIVVWANMKLNGKTEVNPATDV